MYNNRFLSDHACVIQTKPLKLSPIKIFRGLTETDVITELNIFQNSLLFDRCTYEVCVKCDLQCTLEYLLRNLHAYRWTVSRSEKRDCDTRCSFRISYRKIGSCSIFSYAGFRLCQTVKDGFWEERKPGKRGGIFKKAPRAKLLPVSVSLETNYSRISFTFSCLLFGLCRYGVYVCMCKGTFYHIFSLALERRYHNFTLATHGSAPTRSLIRAEFRMRMDRLTHRTRAAKWAKNVSE